LSVRRRIAVFVAEQSGLPLKKVDAMLNQLLETVKVDQDKNLDQMRFPVQYVNRPNLDFRGFCGTLASGTIHPGDEVTALPSGKSSKVESIYTHDGDLDVSYPGQAITITLEDEIDVSRGDMIVHKGHEPTVTNKLDAHVVWMDENPLRTHKEYTFKFATKSCSGRVTDIAHKVDVNTLEQHAQNSESLDLNEIGFMSVSLTDKVAVDEYRVLPQTGAFIIIDRFTNVTVGAGVVYSTAESLDQARQYSQSEKDLNAYVRKHFPEWGCIEI